MAASRSADVLIDRHGLRQPITLLDLSASETHRNWYEVSISCGFNLSSSLSASSRSVASSIFPVDLLETSYEQC